MSKGWVNERSAMILTFDLETWSRSLSLHTPYQNLKTVLVNSEKDWAKGKEIMVLNWIWKRSGMILPWFKVNAHLYSQALFMWDLSQTRLREIHVHSLDKNFSQVWQGHHLKTLFKVTTHLYPKALSGWVMS